jgi:hypothetical protein
MKRVTLLAVLVASLLAGSAGVASATEVGYRRPFGLGFALGTPTSIVGKYFIGSYNAIDFGIGFWRYRACYNHNDRRYCEGGGVGLAGDYLWQEPLARGTANLDWHIGVGARLWAFDDYYSNNFGLAARMPVGLDLTFARPSFVEVFLELAPALYFVPTALDIEAFLGVRFYF